MDFRLVPKSVTLNDLERRNGRVVCLISLNSLDFWAYRVKVVGDRPILSRSEMKPEESSFHQYIIYSDICRESPPREGVEVNRPPCR